LQKKCRDQGTLIDDIGLGDSDLESIDPACDTTKSNINKS